MWPGDQQAGGQSGGEQYPAGNSPQQPQGPYGQPPNPYAQPGYQQPGYPQSGQQPPVQPPGPPVQPGQPPYPPTQPYGTPSPYAQPGYQQTGQQPGYSAPGQPGPIGYPTPQPFPGGPGGGQPPGRSRTTIGIAIGAALAVIAAVVVTVVLVGKDDGKKTDAHDSTSPSVSASTATTTATPTPTATGTMEAGGGDDDEDNPRGPAGSTDVQPVIAGWKVVKRGERNSAFDVPPGWTVGSESMSIGYGDDAGDPQVVAGAPAYYMEDTCKDGKITASNAIAGTKGGAGAASLQAAAENEARAWAKYAFQENDKGTVSPALNSKAFHNSHGITGWQAQATTTNVPKANKCSSNGIAYAVAWLDPAQKTPTPVVWVLWARTGVSGQLAQSVVDQIMSTIRPIKQ